MRKQKIFGVLLALTCVWTSSMSLAVPQKSSIESDIIHEFVDHVVIKSYQELWVESQNFQAKIEGLVRQSTPEALALAQSSWKKNRMVWEKTESFLFGPVDSLGIDPALDTWPIEEAILAASLEQLAQLQASDLWDIDPSLKGFHTLEYLLFGEEAAKTVDQLIGSELRYLQLVAEHQVELSKLLLQSWVDGTADVPAYGKILKSAGHEDNIFYASPRAVIEEMIEGMIAVAEELYVSKLGAVLEENDVSLLESRFSKNTAADLRHNLLGIKAVYFGRDDNLPSINSLAALIEQQNPEIDQKIRLAIDSAMQSLDEINIPLEDAVRSEQQAKNLQDLLSKLETLFQVLDTDLRQEF